MLAWRNLVEDGSSHDSEESANDFWSSSDSESVVDSLVATPVNPILFKSSELAKGVKDVEEPMDESENNQVDSET